MKSIVIALITVFLIVGCVVVKPGHGSRGPGNSENAPGHDPRGPGNSENAPGHNKGH